VRRRLLAVTAVAGLIVALPGGVLAARTSSGTPVRSTGAPAIRRAFANLERVTAADELGFARPGGLAWNAAAKRLSVFDLARPGRGVEATSAGAPIRAITGNGAAGTFSGANAARVRVSLTGTFRGLAVHPTSHHLFTYAPASRTLWELDAAGKPVAQRSLATAGLDDVRAIVIAPSADTSDAAGRMSAYVTDAGRVVSGRTVGSGLYEIVLSAPYRASTLTAAAVGSVTLVRTINTGAGSTSWTPDSPDPSGLAYVPSRGLVAVDGEVEETTGAGFHGANGWFSTLTGTSTGTFNTVPASPTNKEPVGAAYDPARNELYISKDGAASTVWVYNATTMALLRSFNVSAAPYNDLDAEGLGFGNGILYMVDAIDNDMVKVLPGPNGVVGTGGDDVVSDYDLQQYGQDEPEGLDVDPVTGNIWIVSNKISGGGTPEPMIEVTSTGALVSSVSLAAANPNSPGGLAIAPPSAGGAGYNLYVADRGVDNNDVPSENDGKIYEFSTTGGPPPPPPPGEERMTNLGFELDANSDGKPDAWTINNGFTRSSSSVHGGSFAGQHFLTTDKGYDVYQTATGITGGTTYAFSGWVNIPPTTDAFTFQIQLKWRNSSGNVGGTTTLYTATAATAGWTHVAANAAAPAGATEVRVMMKVKKLNATIYVDDFSLFG
jgi:hypothetical protein